MAREYHCANCGKTGYGSAGSGPMSGSNPPSGWKWKWGSTRMFCSNRCKDEYNSRNSSKNSNENKSSSSDSIIGNMLKSDDQKMRDSGMTSAEIATIKAAKEETRVAEANASAIREQEYTKRTIAEQQIKLEKHKLREEKIKELRAEKKYIRVFAMEHPYLFGISSFVLFSLLLKIFLFITTIGDGDKIQKSIDLSQNLENIENQIILGINSKEPKEKLLELITQLNHPDVENKIQGKKRDIIDPDIPDSDFYGTYSEYWTAKRDAYKNIVLKGETLDDYFRKESKDDPNNIENVSEESEDFTEAEGEIIVEGFADKVYFYDKPNTESITRGYFVKGQQAKLLGTSGDFSKVRFEFKGKVTEKFVQTYQISEINTNSTYETEESVDPEYQEVPYQEQ